MTNLRTEFLSGSNCTTACVIPNNISVCACSVRSHSFDTEMLTERVSPPPPPSLPVPDLVGGCSTFSAHPPMNGRHLIKPQVEKPRRTSTGCMATEVAAAEAPKMAGHKSSIATDGRFLPCKCTIFVDSMWLL